VILPASEVLLKRIGIFGGTFDPIHFGHLRAALEVHEGFALDEILFIPAALPPHKTPAEITDAARRLEMVIRAIDDHLGFRVSDIELKRRGPSYTIDTVRRLRQALHPSGDLYLIVGLDAFLEIHTWKSYRELLAETAFIVIARPLSDAHRLSSRRDALEAYLRERISKDYRFSKPRACFTGKDGRPIHLLDVTALDISSTRIRRLVKNGRSIRYLVPESVREFIHNEGLY